MPKTKFIKSSDGLLSSRRPGEWTKNGMSADITCPSCGGIGSLKDHDISPEGLVMPSLMCPRGCGFHEHGVLEDYG